MENEPTIEEVTSKVVELGARLKEKNKEIAKIKAVIETLETFLLGKMLDAGLQSMSVLTEGGRVTVSHKTNRRVNVADWDEVLGFILENEKYELLYKNISSKATEELINSGVDVPGVNIYSVEAVSVQSK